MLYQFSAGIRITSTDAYQTLDGTQKAQARSELIALVQAVVDVMGEQRTDNPRQCLTDLLAGIPAGDWGVGTDLLSGIRYIFDPETGSFVCINDMKLTSSGSDYEQTVTVAGTEITSTFYVRQSANN